MKIGIDSLGVGRHGGKCEGVCVRWVELVPLDVKVYYWLYLNKGIVSLLCYFNKYNPIAINWGIVNKTVFSFSVHVCHMSLYPPSEKLWDGKSLAFLCISFFQKRCSPTGCLNPHHMQQAPCPPLKQTPVQPALKLTRLLRELQVGNFWLKRPLKSEWPRPQNPTLVKSEKNIIYYLFCHIYVPLYRSNTVLSNVYQWCYGVCLKHSVMYC